MSRRRRKPKPPKVRIAIAVIVCGILGAVLGVGTGTWYGGNHARDFSLGSLRGYEAVGLIGLMLGVLWGAVLGGLIGWGLVKMKP